MAEVFRRTPLAVAAVLLLFDACSMREPRDAQPAVEDVWLLHGLGRKASSMEELGECLAGVGYRVTYWSYDSMDEGIDRLGGDLRAALVGLDDDDDDDVFRVHLVTHSMGGIITRQALADGVPPRLGRVVMLSPPNQGSWLAELAEPMVGWTIPAMGELSSDDDSLVNRLPPVTAAEVGIIAGRFDAKAPVETTHMKGERDHIVLPAAHTFIMGRADTCRQVIHFLQEGSFEHPDEEGEDAPP